MELFTPTPITVFAFSQSLHQRGKIGVLGDDHERVNVLFGVAEIKRINDHANICRVLAGLANMRDLNELESGFVHRGLELLVAIPIAIRLLDDNATLYEKSLQHRLYVEARILGVPRSQQRESAENTLASYLIPIPAVIPVMAGDDRA